MTRGPRAVLPWAAALAAIVLFCALGSWQLDRAGQKRAMLEEVRQTLEARRAVPLQAAAAADRAQGYDWAAGVGRFTDAPVVLLDNQNRDGRPGVRVYRAFRPRGAVQPLLVDLGWLPVPADRTLPDPPRPEGELRVEGLLSPPFAGGIAHAAPAVQAGGGLLVIAVDPAVLGPALGLREPLSPRVLRLDPALPLGHARDLDVLPNTLPPERHLGYAVQWFGLAATVLVTALLLGLRKSRSAKRRTSHGRNPP